MPFEIVRNDLTLMSVDAIVNTANPKPVVGYGTDAAVHAKAGPELLKARQKIGELAVGTAAVTEGYHLNADYVIHTAGPVWQGGLKQEEVLLRRCYDAALTLAVKHHCRSVAFPLISTGVYGFPKDRALRIALAAFGDFLLEHDLLIYLVIWDRDTLRLSEKLFSGIESYIDEHYIAAKETEEYGLPSERMPFEMRRLRRDRERQMIEYAAMEESFRTSAPTTAAMAPSLDDLLKQEDAGFTETLLKMIDNTGKKDSEIYKKANLSKQHFSKIRNNPQYRPTKQTALALAIALELNLEQTKDLIGRAGYALTNSSKFDLIIRYFIEQGRYDILEINTVLYDFDQMLLGAG